MAKRLDNTDIAPFGDVRKLLAILDDVLNAHEHDRRPDGYTIADIRATLSAARNAGWAKNG